VRPVPLRLSASPPASIATRANSPGGSSNAWRSPAPWRRALADEPTASLDSTTGAEVATRIRALAKQEGCAAVVVTRDQRILRIADRVLEMEDGRLRASEDPRLAA
jgi:ABC-type hemin transport system ATPase subunit